MSSALHIARAEMEEVQARASRARAEKEEVARSGALQLKLLKRDRDALAQQLKRAEAELALCEAELDEGRSCVARALAGTQRTV